MTSTEIDLIDRQRSELLELGFRQQHGFLYVIHLGQRSVEATILSTGEWVLDVYVWSPGVGRDLLDKMTLSQGISLPTFVAVVGSLID